MRGGTRLRPGRARSFADSASVIWSLETDHWRSDRSRVGWSGVTHSEGGLVQDAREMLEIGMHWHLDQQLDDMERD